MKLTQDSVSDSSGPGIGVHTASQSSQHYKGWPNNAAFEAPGEQREKIQLKVSGHIPSYVAGSLYRTGPGSMRCARSRNDKEIFSVHHWFDGFTTLHKFEIAPQQGQETQVRYSSRCQVDGAIEYARQTGKLEGVTFGQKRDPCDTFYQKVKTMFKPIIPTLPDRANIGVAITNALPSEKTKVKNTVGGEFREVKLLSLTTDTDTTKQIDADTLEPMGIAHQKELHPSLKGPMSAAHPARDPDTGDVYNYNLEMGMTNTYRIFRANLQTGEVEVLAEISGRDIQAAYIHSFFLTANFVVLCIWPAFFKGKGASILWEQNLLDAMAFDSKAKATWLVVDRRHGRGLVRKFTSPAFFSFHTTNAWEEQAANDASATDIVCELVTFQDNTVVRNFYYDNLLSNGPNTASFNAANGSIMRPTLSRYRLSGVPSKSDNSDASKVGQATLVLQIPSPKAGDLQHCNPAYKMRPHRYVWSTLHRGKASFVDGLGKTDTETQTCAIWECARHTPGEPVFIAAPNPKSEDDGVLLSVVLNGDTGTSYLLCLDAQTMTEMGRADVGRPVGMGFHGLHVPST